MTKLGVRFHCVWLTDLSCHEVSPGIGGDGESVLIRSEVEGLRGDSLIDVTGIGLCCGTGGGSIMPRVVKVDLRS